MKQQINLYEAPPESNLWKDYSPWPQISSGLMGLLVVLALFLLWQQSSLDKQLAEKRNQLQTTKARFEQLKQKMPAQTVSSSLEKEVADLERQFKDKQALMTAIGTVDVGNIAGFSQHLEGLARRSVDGLWLTRIELFEGGNRMGFEGIAHKPEYVPQLIKGLGNEAAFNGAEFDIFHLKQQDNALGFNVSTTREGK